MSDRVLTQATLEWVCRMDSQEARRAAGILAQLDVAGAAGAEPFLSACQSPSERQFALGFFMIEGWKTICLPSGILEVLSPNGTHIRVRPQEEVTSIRERTALGRLDFGLQIQVRPLTEQRPETDAFVTIGVEIDGHEWHERTKEQARADRQRERNIVAKSHVHCIVRFTGSEVFADPLGCVIEAIDALTARRSLVRAYVIRMTGGAI